MRVKLSGLLSDLDGKLSGTVFQKNGSGIIARNQPAPINKRSIAQDITKIANVYCQQSWAQLSASDINLWKNLALFLNISHKKNKALTISGHQLFLKVNMLRYQMQKSVPSIIPVIVSTPSITTLPDQINVLSITNTGGTLDVVLDFGLNITTGFIVLSATAPLRDSQSSQYNKMRIIHYTQVNTDTQDIKAGYESIYGRSPNVGEWINVTVQFSYKGESTFSIISRARLQVQ